MTAGFPASHPLLGTGKPAVIDRRYSGDVLVYNPLIPNVNEVTMKISPGFKIAITVLLGLITALAASPQRPQLSTQARAFVKVDAPVVALTNARVIDGTGAPARPGQTIIIRDEKIAAMGATG